MKDRKEIIKQLDEMTKELDKLQSSPEMSEDEYIYLGWVEALRWVLIDDND